MTSSRSGQVAAGMAVAGVALAGALLAAREATMPLPESAVRLLYLQSGARAERAFLTFDALAADVYWMRSIQHYGRDRRSKRTTDRFELLYPLLDLTTTLDPQFNVAYRFGAVFLASDPPDGPARADQAIRLLEKGLSRNPTRWQYTLDAGFVHYWYTGDYQQAATWFERAASMPKAPDWILPLAALTRAEGGDRADARRMLAELMSSDQSYLKAAAERALAQLQALDAIDHLKTLVGLFRSTTGRSPSGWDDLIRAGMLPGLPADPARFVFRYDPATETITISPESSLLPLPRGLAPR